MRGFRDQALAVAFLLCFGVEIPAYASDTLFDDFEDKQLSTIWSQSRLLRDQVWMDKKVVRKGRQSLAIKIDARNFDPKCECQRNELREADAVQLNFGSDIWYRFSIKIEKDTQEIPESRWLLAAWKQDGDGSPFLALRYDRGIFYVTMESNATRVLLASSLIDVRMIFDLLQLKTDGGTQKYNFISDPELYRGKTALTMDYGLNPYLPDPSVEWVDMLIRVKGDLSGNGIVEISANNNLIVMVNGVIGTDNFSDNKQYLRIGQNRDPIPLETILYLDDFRRGDSRSEVE
jgi:hypothetical protein